ncbi:MAG: DUF2064 domain-containing protein, partial [Magnetococcus sp. DMHC-8]
MAGRPVTATMTRILLFAKAPRPGFAKTRLIPLLGAEGAAAMARRMLMTTLASAVEARVGAVELCVTPESTHPAWQSVEIPAGVIVTHQGEGDLGARLARAAARHQEPRLLIGTDCVEMSPALLRTAAAALQTVDALLHPTAD